MQNQPNLVPAAVTLNTGNIDSRYALVDGNSNSEAEVSNFFVSFKTSLSSHGTVF